MGVVLPIIFIFALGSEAGTLTTAQFLSAANTLANTGSTYFVLIPVVLPSIMGSYSIVGEKIEKSLEPLLATPTTDGELLFGKSLATFLPTIGVTYIGAAIFITIMDIWSYIRFGTTLASERRFSCNSGVDGAFSLRLKRRSQRYYIFQSKRHTRGSTARDTCSSPIDISVDFINPNLSNPHYFARLNCIWGLSGRRHWSVLLSQNNLPKRRNTNKMEINPKLSCVAYGSQKIRLQRAILEYKIVFCRRQRVLWVFGEFDELLLC